MPRRKKGKKTTNAKKASYNGVKKGATDFNSRGGNVKSGGVVKGIDSRGRKFTRDTKKQKRDALIGRWTFNTSSKVKEIAKKGKTGEGFAAGKKAVTQNKLTLTSQVNKASLKKQLQNKLDAKTQKDRPKSNETVSKGDKETTKQTVDKTPEPKPKEEPKKDVPKPAPKPESAVTETDDGYVGKESKQPKATSVEAKFADNSFLTLANQLDNVTAEQKETINKALGNITDETEKSIVMQLLFRDQPTKTNQKLADKVRKKILQGETDNLLTVKQMVALKASMIKHFEAGKLSNEANQGITGDAVKKVAAANKKLKTKAAKDIKDVKKAVDDSTTKKAKDIKDATPKRPKNILKEPKPKTSKDTPKDTPKVVNKKFEGKYQGQLLFGTDKEANDYIADQVKDVNLTPANREFVEQANQDINLVKLGQKLGYKFKMDYNKDVGGYHKRAGKIIALTPAGLTPEMRELNPLEHELVHALQYLGQGATTTKDNYLTPVGIDYTNILSPKMAARYVSSDSYDNGRTVPYELESFAASYLGGNRVLATALKIGNDGLRSRENKSNVDWWVELGVELNNDKRYREALRGAAETYPELAELYSRTYNTVAPADLVKDFKSLDSDTLGKAIKGITNSYPPIEDDTGTENKTRRASVEKDLRSDATEGNLRTLRTIMNDNEDLYDMLDEAVNSLNSKLTTDSPFSINSLTTLITDLNTARFLTATDSTATFEQQKAIIVATQRAKLALFNIWQIADDKQKAQLLKQSGLTLENLSTFTGGVLSYDAS